MTYTTTDSNIERATADNVDVEATTPPYPSRPGIPLGISAEQLKAAQRVLEAEINKARAGQSSAADTRP